MLGITSLVRNTLSYSCTSATSLALRSHPRNFFSSDRVDWNDVFKYPKIRKVYQEGEESVDSFWERNSKILLNSMDSKAPENPYSGRSVIVKGGNVAHAYGRLQSILQRNRVQAQLRLTERHEKKGVKRRRLSSERWRRQFANEVRNKVQLVAKIRSRGA